MVAPESPGIGFFGGAERWPQVAAKANELCSHYLDLPTDGSKLPADVVAVGKFFLEHHEKPTIVGSPALVQPNRSGENPNKLVEPLTMRVYLLNLGDRDATNVRVRLRNAKETGGNVFAETVVPLIPKRTEVNASLPVKTMWKCWTTWGLEVEAEGADVRIYKLKH